MLEAAPKRPQTSFGIIGWPNGTRAPEEAGVRPLWWPQRARGQGNEDGGDMGSSALRELSGSELMHQQAEVWLITRLSC
jgi:hypothetical protein